MSRKNYSIDQLSTETRRRAQSEMSILRGELCKLRAKLGGVNALGRHPLIKTKRTYTKKVTESAFDDLGFTDAADLGISFSASYSATQTERDGRSNGYQSGEQEAARATERYSLGLRLR